MVLVAGLIGGAAWARRPRTDRLRAPAALATTGMPSSEPATRPPDPAMVEAWQEMAARPTASAPRQLTASLQLTGPAEVWVGQPFGLRCHGSYDLPPDLARSLLNGDARLEEEYSWTSLGGLEAPGYFMRETERSAVIPLGTFGGGPPPESMETVVSYRVVVTDLGQAQPHFFTEEASAPRYQRAPRAAPAGPSGPAHRRDCPDDQRRPAADLRGPDHPPSRVAFRCPMPRSVGTSATASPPPAIPPPMPTSVSRPARQSARWTTRASTWKCGFRSTSARAAGK